MKHICYISTTFNHRGGHARRAYPIMRRLADNGHRVSLIVGRDFAPNPSWNFRNISVFQEKTLTKYADVWRDLNCLANLVKLLVKLRPDLVHTALAKAGFTGRLAARIAGVPIIVHTVHGPTFVESMGFLKRNAYWMLEALAGKTVSQFVFVGRELADYYIKSGVATKDRCVVIHSGLFSMNSVDVQMCWDDIEQFRSSICKDPDCFIMLSVGRVVPSKQQEHAIHALAALRGRGIGAELLVAGEAFLPEERYYQSHLMDLTRKLGVAQHVHYLGFCENILQMMSASDVLVLTSKYEGLPNIAIEAALVGCPIVGYEVLGIREVIIEEGSPIIIPQGDLSALIGALIKVASTTRRKKVSLQENKLRLKRFSTEHLLDSKLSFYNSLLGG